MNCLERFLNAVAGDHRTRLVEPIFDRHLQRIQRWLSRNPATVLVIASSMGQAPSEPRKAEKCYVLRDPELLTRTLCLDANEALPAMYPDYGFLFESSQGAKRAVEQLARVEVGTRPFFKHSLAEGNTVTTKLASYKGDQAFVMRGGDGGNNAPLTLKDLGVALEERLGGGNTAYHVPEGIWIAFARGVEPDSSRAEFSILETKCRILNLLGLAPVPTAGSESAASSG